MQDPADAALTATATVNAATTVLASTASRKPAVFTVAPVMPARNAAKRAARLKVPIAAGPASIVNPATSAAVTGNVRPMAVNVAQMVLSARAANSASSSRADKLAARISAAMKRLAVEVEEAQVGMAGAEEAMAETSQRLYQYRRFRSQTSRSRRSTLRLTHPFLPQLCLLSQTSSPQQQ